MTRACRVRGRREGQVQLAGDRRGLLDQHPQHLAALGRRLWRLQHHADDLPRRRLGGVGVVGQLHPARLASPAGVDLRLHDDRPPSRVAMARASSGACATPPFGTGTPKSRRISLPWYSWIFIVSEGGSRPFRTSPQKQDAPAKPALEASMSATMSRPRFPATRRGAGRVPRGGAAPGAVASGRRRSRARQSSWLRRERDGLHGPQRPPPGQPAPAPQRSAARAGRISGRSASARPRPPGRGTR